MNVIEPAAHSASLENPTPDEESVQRPRAQLEALSKRYVVAKNHYYLRDEQRTLAFSDTGSKVSTRLDDPRIARSMVELAAAKGWQTLSVSGSLGFRREVWLAAALRGLPVRGYTPKDVDQAQLLELQEEGMGARPTRNAPKPGRSAAPPKEPASEPVGELTRAQSAVVDTITTIMRERGDSESAIQRAQALALERLVSDRVHVGQILEARSERFEHDSEGRMSFVVKLATPQGEREVWGVDLQRALREGRVAIGSHVAISYEGRTLVDVIERDPDHPGATRTLRTYQNTWRTTDLDRLTQVARERVMTLARQPAQPEPVIRVYDIQAAPATPRLAPQPSRQPGLERSRG